MAGTGRNRNKSVFSPPPGRGRRGREWGLEYGNREVGSGKSEVDETFLRQAIDDFIPSASQADIDLMTLLAILESSSRRLLPPNLKEIIQQIRVRNLLPNGPDLIRQVEARKIVKLDPIIPTVIQVSSDKSLN